mmetsp:Transcript_164008/g.521449  ORF Transcript_164008/g.521449 Transcript_164008/m.521449 type:complete len:347 (-) Transcript_164008:21-1061(-)
MWALRLLHEGAVANTGPRCRSGGVAAARAVVVFGGGGGGSVFGGAAERSFGTELQIKKLRLKGVVGRAFRQSAPPKLHQKATDHYVKVLRAHGSAEATRQLAEAKAVSIRQQEQRQDSLALTSEEKTLLLWRYVPDESEALNTLRKQSHRWLWRFIKRNDWKRFDVCLEQLRTRDLAFDEVTYNLVLFGILLHRRKDDELVRQVYAEMVDERRFHPALLRLQGGFVESYFELKEVDAAPNPVNLVKCARTFWQISVNFKRQRIKELRTKLADAATRQRQRLLRERGAEAVGLSDEALLLPVYDSDRELSDGENKPRVKFPAQRPRQLRGVFKGSGVPNRRKHRWKH